MPEIELEGKNELAWMLGWALLPFIVSVIYGCTKCGDKKIAWPKDVLALVLSIVVFWLAQKLAMGSFVSSFEGVGLAQHWWILAADLVAFLAVTFALCILYAIFYAGGPKEAHA